jgi:DNA-nicking Smr family endonuclease
MNKKRSDPVALPQEAPSERFWEKVFLKEERDIEANPEAFRGWMDQALSAMDLAAAEKAESEPQIKQGGRTPRSKPDRRAWDEAACLDLHGLTSDQAVRELNLMLNGTYGQSCRWVRIIVGKGHNSPDGRAVLRDLTESWIIEKKRAGKIVDWFWEKKRKNKSGSVLIRLSAGSS